MKSVHLVIPDLFLPEDIAAEVCADLRLPALEKILARGASTGSDPSTGSERTGEGGCLENHLCEFFGVICAEDAPIAAIGATFDGLGEGCWLRADPVHLRLQRDQLLLLPDMEISADEAGQMCASLNEHFAGQGMEFFAPHPQRWYVRLDAPPRIRTMPLSAVLGSNVRRALPTGEDAAHWHQLLNEIQMLLFAHPLNEAREAHGELAINSVWLWGAGGPVGVLQKTCDSVSSDDVLSEMFAAAAGVPFSAWPKRWDTEAGNGMQLLVWTGLRSALQGGDLAAWRAALQDFEAGYALPLWQALRSGRLGQLKLDILGEHGIRRVRLTRGDTLAFWRRTRRLAEYSLT
jgi:hypothetical protein